MSDIRVDTISAANGTDPVTLTKQSAAKAWVNVIYTSGTPSTIGSLNSSSLTDNNTGTYTVNFSNNFDSANNMAVSGTGCSGTGASNEVNVSHGDLSASSQLIKISDSGGIDQKNTMVFHGDLA